MTLNRLRLRPTQLITHRGLSFLSVSQHGLIPGSEHGLYLHQTRFLSRFEITNDALTPVCADVVDARRSISYFLLASPAGKAAGPAGGSDPGGGEIAEKGVELRLVSSLDHDAQWVLTLTNHALAETEVALDLHFAADFADLQEVSSGRREQDAPVKRLWQTGLDGGGVLTFRYDHPALRHETLIRLSGDCEISEHREALRCNVVLRPRAPRILRIAVTPVFQGEPRRIDPPAFDSDEVWNAACAQLEGAVPGVQDAWDRAVEDLRALQILEGEGAERWVPIAGVPKYAALFGRDTLVASIQSALLTPATLEGTLKKVGRWTAKTYDDRYDAQPGRILHQRQLSPLALLGENPFKHYYGDYSAPGWYILGAALHYAHTADRAAFEAVRDNVEATLAWMDRDGDLDGDGFYEYVTRAGKQGIKNQGWKDSGQAILYPDGAMVDDPIAVTEVQGLYYAAKQALALAYQLIGESGRAEELFAQASALKTRFNAAFWMPQKDYFAIALDPDKRPVETVASDPGACLAYGIIDDDKAEAVAKRLLAPDMFSGWGVRTLSVEHPAYNPLAYHLGTVWPMPNGCICYGLRRYGFDTACQTVAKAQIDATRLFEFHRLPEVFGGFARDGEHPHPGIYPGACSPQAWSSSAVIQMIQSMLGVIPLAPLERLVVNPALPDWLPGVTLRNIQVGTHRLDLRFERNSDGRTEVETVSGNADLLFRPSDSVGRMTPGDRLPRILQAVCNSVEFDRAFTEPS